MSSPLQKRKPLGMTPSAPNARLNSSDSTVVATLSEASFSRPASSTCAADFTEQELVQAGNLLRLLRRRIERDVRVKAGQIRSGGIQPNGPSSTQAPQECPAGQTPARHVIPHHLVRSARPAARTSKLAVPAPASDFRGGEFCAPTANRALRDVRDASLHDIRTIFSEHQKPAEHTRTLPTNASSAHDKNAELVQHRNTICSQQVEKDARTSSVCLSGELSFATVDSARDSASRHGCDLSVVEYNQPVLEANAQPECLPVSPLNRSICPSPEASWCSTGTKDEHKDAAVHTHTRPRCDSVRRPLALSAVRKTGPKSGAGVEAGSRNTERTCVSVGRGALKVLDAAHSKTTSCAEKKADDQAGTHGTCLLSSTLTLAQGTSTSGEDDTTVVEGSAKVDDEQIERCPDCSRTFKCSAFKKHAKICRKVFMTKRKEFDVAKKRVAGLSEEAGVVLCTGRRQMLNSRAQCATIDSTLKPQSKWRKQSEQFRAAMRMTRLSDPAEIAEAQAILAEFSEAAASYKCPHCSRTFGRSEALEKHQRVCLRLFRSTPVGLKPGVSARSSKMSVSVGKGDMGTPAYLAGGVRGGQGRPRLSETKKPSFAGRACASLGKSSHVAGQSVSSTSSFEKTTPTQLATVSEKPLKPGADIHRAGHRRNSLQRHATN